MKPSLFFGIPVDNSLEEALKQANPALRALFLSGDPYLERLEVDQNVFIGKWLENPLRFDELDNIESNIKSFLRRLTSDFVIEKDFILFSKLSY